MVRPIMIVMQRNCHLLVVCTGLSLCSFTNETNDRVYKITLHDEAVRRVQIASSCILCCLVLDGVA